MQTSHVCPLLALKNTQALDVSQYTLIESVMDLPSISRPIFQRLLSNHHAPT
jgi:hypothetical protein